MNKLLKKIAMALTTIFYFQLFAEIIDHEAVLDRVEHVEPSFKDVPKVAPLCDELPGLSKKYIRTYARP